MPSRPAEQWQHEPTSSAAQPDRVPSKSLPPLSSMDRMANGEHLGQCRTCGGHQWWDNRARKATGEMSRSQPDYVCADCRHGRWVDGRQRSGRAGPAGRRTPSTRVTVVAPVVDPITGLVRGRICAALKRDGSPCRNGAMDGSPFCGPHSDRRRSRAGAEPVPRHDQGRQTVPGWRCAGIRVLPAARASTLTATGGDEVPSNVFFPVTLLDPWVRPPGGEL